MKIIQKMAAVLMYLLLMGILFDFHISALFDWKQFAVVLLGMLFLYVAEGKRDKTDMNAIGRSALMAGCIETCVLLYVRMEIIMADEAVLQYMASSCRPLLYGLLIWCVLSVPISNAKHSDDTKQDNPEDVQTAPEAAHSSDEQDDSGENFGQKFAKLGLTNREIQVAVLAVNGLSNCEIAVELGISETTVKKHLSNIFDKLNITRREELRNF